ncbi:hypothetical protein V6R21_20005 [Limibacter armeniacum]|uniref:hypothetical protein n=1 Tax=Limibacter armeniacum TaxID=466084 RepID=UPI002FE653CE
MALMPPNEALGANRSYLFRELRREYGIIRAEAGEDLKKVTDQLHTLLQTANLLDEFRQIRIGIYVDWSKNTYI